MDICEVQREEIFQKALKGLSFRPVGDYLEYHISYVIVTGPVGVGKSSLVNTLSRSLNCETGLSLKRVTTKNQQVSYKRDGQKIRIVDTPGLFDSYLSETETVKELKRCCEMVSPGPHVILFIMRLGQYYGVETLKSFLEYFGDGVLKHTVIVFTGLDSLDNENLSLDQYLSNSPPFLKDILRRYKYVALDGRAATQDSLKILEEKIQSSITENRGKYYSIEKMEFLKTTKETQIHSSDIATVLNGRIKRVARIVNSWKQDYENENEQQRISAIETILAYPVSKRTRSRNWQVEAENILNGENWKEVMERLPEKSRIQLMQIYDKENMEIKRGRGHSRDASPSTSTIVKRRRQTKPLASQFD